MQLCAVALALLAVLLAGAIITTQVGCGSDGQGEEKSGAEAESGEHAEEEGGEEAAKEEAAKQVPAEDRTAFYQLGISSGLLRSALVARSQDEPAPPRASTPEIRRAAATVRGLEPQDPGLKRIQAAEVALFARVTPIEAVSARQARAELRRLDRINASLSRFLRREPTGAALVPD